MKAKWLLWSAVVGYWNRAKTGDRRKSPMKPNTQKMKPMNGTAKVAVRKRPGMDCTSYPFSLILPKKVAPRMKIAHTMRAMVTIVISILRLLGGVLDELSSKSIA